LPDQYHVRLHFGALGSPDERVVSSVVEQLAFNQLVDGSNPSRPTRITKVTVQSAGGLFLLRKVNIQAGEQSNAGMRRIPHLFLPEKPVIYQTDDQM
jgi:hypothetical protein